MSEQQAKKLNLALYLNPALSDADQAAVTALQQWYEKARQSCGDRTELDEKIRLFHHDLYLAGLRLYLLNPRLCRQVADALEYRDLTFERLAEQLSASGLWAGSQEKTFSAGQMEQLEQLLAAVPSTSEADSEATVNGDAPEASMLSQQLNEQRGQLSAMQEELQQLRALAEEQAQQLRRMKLAAPAAREPKASKSGEPEEMDVTDMGTQIAQMQKIREKGVF